MLQTHIVLSKIIYAMSYLQYVHLFTFSASVIQFGTLHYGFLQSLQVADSEEVFKSVLSINLKDKGCDFFKIYIYLVLVENWLLSTEQTPVILRMWGAFLRNCSCQITSTDWRSYASKVRNCTFFPHFAFILFVPSSIQSFPVLQVRNKASYILQNTSQKFD